MERTSLVIEPQAPVDEPWNTEFRAVAEQGAEVFELLRPDADTLAAEKAEFFASGRTYVPDLRPTKIDVEKVNAQEQSLLAWKSEFLADENVPDGVRQLYRWRVNEVIANNRILQAAVSGDMMRFRAYNRFIYGAPEPAIAAAAADWFRTEAQEVMAESDVAAVHEAGELLLATVPDLGGDRRLLVPDPETFAAVKDRHMRAGGYYALLFAGVTLPERGPIRPDVGEPVLEQVKQNLHAHDYEIVDAEGTVWSASHNPPQMKRPAKYNMTLPRFMGLGPGHELGTHILERINGDRQPVRLLGYGFDRNEFGGEGRSVIREQIVFPSFEVFRRQLRMQDIVRRHLAVSLADGIDGQRRDTATLINTMNTIDRFWERNKKPDDIEAADAKADTRSWDLAVRVGRGGDVYLKDKVYLAGNVACWAAARENPDLIDLGDLGKFDVTNKRHLTELHKLGVLPALR